MGLKRGRRAILGWKGHRGVGRRVVQAEEVAFARVGNSSVIQEPMRSLWRRRGRDLSADSAVAPRAGLKSLA